MTVAGTAVRYDAVVIATGATARGLPGARTLRTAEDAVAVRAALDDGARTVVIGAGFIGSEVASAARKRGLPVTIVEAAAVPLVRAVGEEAGAALAGLHHAAGTGLRLATEVTGVAAGGVRLSTGEVLPADLVVAGIGADPATGWLEGSGLTLHERDRGVVCDATLSAGPPGVYAAGDVAHVANPLFDGEPMRPEHWTNAAEQGAAAARHALDPAGARAFEAVPYFWSDWYGHRIQSSAPRVPTRWVSCGRGDAVPARRPARRRADRRPPARDHEVPQARRRAGRVGRSAGLRGRGLEWRS